jgi:hypothetical protein
MVVRTLDVFINCPFDADYRQFFDAIVFTVLRSGFRPRCARETDDASENRFEKICAIVDECRYGIHDISRTELDPDSRLPRFNMPLELGLFLGAKRFGDRAQKTKRCIVLDTDRYRFQKYISDIAGQDIHAHEGKLSVLIREVAAWLRDHRPDPNVPGGQKIAAEFDKFQKSLPKICKKKHLQPDELTFGDYAAIIVEYLALLA